MEREAKGTLLARRPLIVMRNVRSVPVAVMTDRSGRLLRLQAGQGLQFRDIARCGGPSVRLMPRRHQAPKKNENSQSADC